MNKVVVTGCAGFIGSHLTDKLIELGYEVIGIDNLFTGKRENVNPNCKFYELDLSIIGIDALSKLIKGSDCVFHVAALARVQPSFQQPYEYYLQNALVTNKLLECCRLTDIKKFVYSSSSSVYGDSKTILEMCEHHFPNPISPYAYYKLAGEQSCELYKTMYGINTVCLRYFNVYGTRMTPGYYTTALQLFMNTDSDTLYITGDGSQTRDFTYVNDVVYANIESLKRINLVSGHIINIGSGVSYSILDIAKCFKKKIEFIPQVFEPKNTLANINKAVTLLNYKPTENIKHWISNNI